MKFRLNISCLHFSMPKCQLTVRNVNNSNQFRNVFEENSTLVHFRKFYSVLERELDLEHGRLLLALGSPAELEAIIKKDLPFLDRYRTEVTTCLQEVIVNPQVQDL